MTQQNNPTPLECVVNGVVNGTECYDDWVWAIYLFIYLFIYWTYGWCLMFFSQPDESNNPLIYWLVIATNHLNVILWTVTHAITELNGDTLCSINDLHSIYINQCKHPRPSDLDIANLPSISHVSHKLIFFFVCVCGWDSTAAIFSLNNAGS